HLPLPQLDDLRRLGRSLTAAIPAQVIITTVGVILAVGLVVLTVVGDEISERKAIVAGDEVQAVVWLPATGVVQLRAPDQAGGQGRGHAWIALDEAAHVIAELAVPFRPPA